MAQNKYVKMIRKQIGAVVVKLRPVTKRLDVVATKVVTPEILGIIGLIVTFAGILPAFAAEWTVTMAGLTIMVMAAMFHENLK